MNEILVKATKRNMNQIRFLFPRLVSQNSTAAAKVVGSMNIKGQSRLVVRHTLITQAGKLSDEHYNLVTKVGTQSNAHYNL